MATGDDPPNTLSPSPVGELLGLVGLERTPQGATVRLTPRGEHLQEEGVVQGGILAALADASAVHALRGALGPGQAMTSVEFKLNFLRPALLSAGDLFARSSLVQRGRRIAVLQVELSQDGRELCRGLFTYLLFERGEERPDS